MPQNKIQSVQIQSINSSQITGILTTAQGGTGSNDASVARTNLEVAKSGANSDITSLSGLTTAIKIEQGGTGKTDKTSAFGALSPATTKGDFIVHNGTSNIRLSVGTDGQVLMADSETTTGVKWAPGAVGSVTSIDISGGNTGLTSSGGPITSSGIITLAGTLNVLNGGTGLTAVPGNSGQLLMNTSGAFGSTSKISYNGSNKLTVGDSDNTFTIVGGGSRGIGYVGSNLTIQSGPSANGVNTSGGGSGILTLAGGDGETGSGSGGDVVIRGGVGPAFPGNIYFRTGNLQTERLRIISSGAWGLGGANYGAIGQVLTSNGSNIAPSWKNPEFDLSSPTTTKGDLIVHNGTSNIRLSVGTDGQVLMADSETTTGVKWAPGAVGSVTSVEFSTGQTGLIVTSDSENPITSSGKFTLSGTLGISSGGTNRTTIPGSSGQLLMNSGGAYSATTRISYDGNSTLSLGALAGGGSSFTIKPVDGSGVLTAPALIIVGGNSNNDSQIYQGAGHVYIRGGTASGGAGIAGNLYLEGGSGSGSPGNIQLLTGVNRTERLRIASNGAWGLGGDNYGTSGQVLTSNGSSAAPTWQSLSSTGIGTVTSVAFSGGETGLSVTGSPITSSGTITLAGTLAVANGGTGTSNGNITGTAALTFTAGGTNTNINLVPIGTGTVDVASKRITNLATPTQNTDAATKQYVDDAVSTGGFTGGTVPNATTFSSAVTLSSSLTFGTAYSESTVSVNAATTTNIDCSLSNNFIVTLNSNITTLTFSNIPASGRLFYLALILRQDATGGRTITWPESVRWPGGVAPIITSTSNKYDIITIMTFDGGTTWSGFVAGQNY